ncbi:hypothetical protein BH11VER1_BH11VER1_05400 [soil metagenome]
MKTKYLSVLIALALPALAKDGPDYRLHEWGTFTSVSGSDGRLLEGVERDVEPLPPFVHSHESSGGTFSVFSKGFAARPLQGVTVKMETPVIYFYTKESFDAEVSVGFKGGSISQWYPSRSGGEKLPFRGVDPVTKKSVEGAMDFRNPFDGSIQWKVAVEPAVDDWPARVYHPRETPVWIYPRLPASALVRTPDGETEKYLFYRGVGRFETPVTATFTADRTVRLANTSDDRVPAMMVYELTRDGMVRWKTLNALAKVDPTDIDLDAQAPVPADQARLQVHQAMAKMVTDAGLDRAEADAMILTWQASYFGEPGLRLFWVAPRSFVDRVLPLKVNPPPTATERVILGRLELLSPVWEHELLTRANEAEQATPKRVHPFAYERHWPAYAQRLQQLRSPAPKQSKLPFEHVSR